MLDTLTWATGSAGVALVLANVLGGQAGLPLPCVSTLIIAGALARDHHRWGAEVFVGAIVGCLLIDSGWYLIGSKYGSRFGGFLSRPIVPPGCRRGDIARPLAQRMVKNFLVAKSIPGLAVVTSPLAGASGMRFRRFLCLSAVGAAIWVGACLIVGATLQQRIVALLPKILHYGVWWMCSSSVLLTASVLLNRFRRRQASARRGNGPVPSRGFTARLHRFPAEMIALRRRNKKCALG